MAIKLYTDDEYNRYIIGKKNKLYTIIVIVTAIIITIRWCSQFSVYGSNISTKQQDEQHNNILK